MNDLLNSPIIREGTVKIEIRQQSIIMLAAAILITAMMIIMLNFLLRKKA
jgi:hypothetical protein